MLLLDLAEDSSMVAQDLVQAARMPHERSPIDMVNVGGNSNGNADHFRGRSNSSLPLASTRPNEPVDNLHPPPALPPRPHSRSGTHSPVRPLEPNENDNASVEGVDSEDGMIKLDLELTVPELADLVCFVCMAPTTRRCFSCKLEGYCDREHQLLDWPRHANICTAAEQNTAVAEVNDFEYPNDAQPLTSPELPLRSSSRKILVDAILLPVDEDLPRIVKITFDVLNYRHTPIDLERFIGLPPSQETSPSGPSMARWRAARARTVHVDWIEHQWKGGARLEGGARLSVHFRYDTDATYEHRCLAKTVLGPRIGASLSGTGHSVLRRGNMVVLKHPNTAKELVINALLSDYVYVGEYYRGLWGV